MIETEKQVIEELEEGENPQVETQQEILQQDFQGNSRPEQVEMPFAVVQGTAMTEIPHDLYIPPDALEVFLDAFEGPLDLLLYLIKRQNLDILDIPIANITAQYMQYIDLMKDMRFELAAEYLVMAAMLAEIKSRMLLPRVEEDAENEDDPRAELIRRLQEYERFKKAAIELDDLPRMGRDFLPTQADVEDKKTTKLPPDVDIKELIFAFQEVMKRAEMFTHHHIQMEPLSVRERMSDILASMQTGKFVDFRDLFNVKEGKLGIVVTFLAILELVKESLLELVQAEPYADIHVRPATATEQLPEEEQE